MKEKLIEALGLPSETSEEALLDYVGQMHAAKGRLNGALGLPANTPSAEALKSVQTLRADGDANPSVTARARKIMNATNMTMEMALQTIAHQDVGEKLLAKAAEDAAKAAESKKAPAKK